MSVNKLLRNHLRMLKKEEEDHRAKIDRCEKNIKSEKDRLAGAESRRSEFRVNLNNGTNGPYVDSLIREEIADISAFILEVQREIDVNENTITRRQEKLIRVIEQIEEIREALGTEDEHEDNPVAPMIDAGKISTGCINATEAKIVGHGIKEEKLSSRGRIGIGEIKVDINPIQSIQDDRLTSIGVAVDKALRRMQRAMGIKR